MCNDDFRSKSTALTILTPEPLGSYEAAMELVDLSKILDENDRAREGSKILVKYYSQRHRRPDAQLTLKKADLYKLLPRRWLNDELINLFLTMFQVVNNLLDLIR